MKYVYLIVACALLCACNREEPEPAERGVTITVNTEWGEDINVKL